MTEANWISKQVSDVTLHQLQGFPYAISLLTSLSEDSQVLFIWSKAGLPRGEITKFVFLQMWVHL
jgi:hypothetical protein